MSPEVLRLLWRFAALPVLVGLVLGVVLLIYIRSHRPKPPDFWKLASERPDHAYDWFVSHDGWVVVDFDARRHKKPKGAEFVGPFILRVPKLGGRRVAVYGRRGSMEESEETFVRFFGARPEE
jgi:hypothetical protein